MVGVGRLVIGIIRGIGEIGLRVVVRGLMSNRPCILVLFLIYSSDLVRLLLLVGRRLPLCTGWLRDAGRLALWI